MIEIHLLPKRLKVLHSTWGLPAHPGLSPMLALTRYASLSSIPALSLTKILPRVTKLVPRQMSSVTISRLRQLYQQMGAAGSRSISTHTTTSSSTSGHMDGGKSSSLSSPQTVASEHTAKKQPKSLDFPPVLFRSEFAARRFILNRPDALNALNYDMIKMIKEKIDVSLILIYVVLSSICYAGFEWF